MGLGKTVQVLALLLVLRRHADLDRRTSIIVAPASLLANWEAAIARHAPSLKAIVAHPSAMPQAELRSLDTARFADVDLVITS
jgi:non-specific serine/threonine protein kinase